MVMNKVRDKLDSLCIICSLGQVKISLDNTLWRLTCPWASIDFCYFHTSVNGQFMMPYFTPTDLFRHFCHIIKSIKPEIFNFLLIGFTLILSLAVHECVTLV